MIPIDERPVVWSSEAGDLRKLTPKQAKVKSLPPCEQVATLHRESKGRGGKTVSLVRNLVLSDNDLQALAKKLKRACGSGGSVKDGIIIIQGDHRQTLKQVLEKLGYQAKIAGG